jgi:hypothetical protein
MDRYWIAKGHKVEIPSQDEIKQYHKGIDSKPSPLVSKAEVCASIIKLRHPRCSEKEMVRLASSLMDHSMAKLLRIQEDLRRAHRQDSRRKF